MDVPDASGGRSVTVLNSARREIIHCNLRGNERGRPDRILVVSAFESGINQSMAVRNPGSVRDKAADDEIQPFLDRNYLRLTISQCVAVASCVRAMICLLFGLCQFVGSLS